LLEDLTFSLFQQVRPSFARAACAVLGLNPMQVPKESVLSFVMAQHPRLGSSSPFYGLTDDLIKRVLEAVVCFDRGHMNICPFALLGKFGGRRSKIACLPYK
jgi:hypothetical protein